MAICALGFGPGFSGGSGGGSGSVALAGAWDASAGTFPGSGAATKGTQYRVSVAGTVNGVAFDVGDTLEAIVDNASATTYAGNWIIGQGVITAVDISDSTSLGRSILTAANATAAVAAIGILTLANIFTAAQTIRIDSLGATATTASAGIGSYLRNTTAAAAGAQQYSPRSVWEGQGWKTTATAASQAVAFMAETRPVQGTTAPTGTWALAASINGGAYSDVLKVDSVGNLVLSTGKYIWPTSSYINFGNSASSASFTFYTGNSQFIIGSSGSISWTNSGDSYAGTQDLYIYRDVANTLALRNSTSAQTLRAYNTYTDASNGEWGTFDWSQTSNVLSIGTMKNGTGSTRNLQFVVGGTKFLDWGVTNSNSLTLTQPNNNVCQYILTSGLNQSTSQLYIQNTNATRASGAASFNFGIAALSAGAGAIICQFGASYADGTASSGAGTIWSENGFYIASRTTSTPLIFMSNSVERLRISDTQVTTAIASLNTNATGGIGYGTGAGGAVTQATSRTTGVTLNKVTGAITLVSAAGLATWQSFTLTNSAIAATDTVQVVQKSGTDIYMISVSAVAAGSCVISFATTGGVTTEQPVFNFTVIKGVTS